MNKSNYYIFLDIDGTLWDYDYRMYNKSGLLKPESMEALNLLISVLDKNYNPRIVITSRRRKNFEATCKWLYDSGLNKDFSNIDRTPWEEGDRGKKILNYMHVREKDVIYSKNKFKNKLANLMGRKVFKNYVVIDDEAYKLDSYIPEDKIIAPNILSRALSLQHINEYLRKQYLIESNPQDER